MKVASELNEKKREGSRFSLDGVASAAFKASAVAASFVSAAPRHVMQSYCTAAWSSGKAPGPSTGHDLMQWIASLTPGLLTITCMNLFQQRMTSSHSTLLETDAAV